SSEFPASSALRSAFAIALRSVFSMSRAMRFFVKRSVCSASSARCPRIKSITSRAFCGETRTNRVSAVPCICPSVCVGVAIVYPLSLCRSSAGSGWSGSPRSRRSGSPFERCLDGVALERPRGRKFAKLVAYHLFGDVNGDKLLPVVHGDRVSHHLRQDRRPPRPRLHHFLFVPRIHCFHFFAEMAVDKRPFLKRARHLSLVPLFFYPAQLHPLRAAHLAESEHRPGNAMRNRAKRAHKPSALRVRNLVHNHGPAGAAQAIKNLRRGSEPR